MKRMLPLVLASFLFFASCSETKTTTEEKEEINMMDSTEKKLKEAADELKEKTEKVEESLEKLDKKFKDTTDQ